MTAQKPFREVLFEGLKEEEILNLPKEEVEQLILLGEPIVFTAANKESFMSKNGCLSPRSGIMACPLLLSNKMQNRGLLVVSRQYATSPGALDYLR